VPLELLELAAPPLPLLLVVVEALLALLVPAPLPPVPLAPVVVSPLLGVPVLLALPPPPSQPAAATIEIRARHERPIARAFFTGK
jgi:hypothetical protein